MDGRAAPVASTAASLFFLATLAWPYAVRPIDYVSTYYAGGLLNPLVAGGLVAFLLVVPVAVRAGHLSPPTGTGLAVGLAASASLITSVWTLTARLDVFQATGWALPLQRFLLAGAALLILAGIAFDRRRATATGPVDGDPASG